MDYRNANNIIDLLSRIDFTITGQQPGDFSPEHIKYDCLLKSGSHEFRTSYQSNPSVHGTPTVTDLLSALTNDALSAADYSLDDFADELGFTKPSEAIRAYEGCKKSLDFLRDDLALTDGELRALSETLDEHGEEIKEAVKAVCEQKAKDEAYRNPPVPEGFTSISDLEADLYLGDWGDQLTEYEGYVCDCISECADSNVDIYDYDLLKWLPDNYEWLEEADFQGLLEGIKGNLPKMIQMAQYVCYTQDMYDHQGDIAKYVTLEGLKDKGVYALSEDMADRILDGDIDFTDSSNRFSDYLDEAETAISSAIEDAMEEATGGAFCEAEYDEVNPCAMSVKAVHLVNEKGYEAAFAEQWKDVLEPENEDTPSLGDAAKESRASSVQLEDGSPARHHRRSPITRPATTACRGWTRRVSASGKIG